MHFEGESEVVDLPWGKLFSTASWSPTFIPIKSHLLTFTNAMPSPRNPSFQASFDVADASKVVPLPLQRERIMTVLSAQ